jgi:hypothetical protein
MADFKFIVTSDLRHCLESDYKELRACLTAQAWKAVHVLAGSIIEAVLIDALITQQGIDSARLQKMRFVDVINLAKSEGLLSDEAVDLSTVVRKYRNLIHPAVVIRLEKNVNEDEAQVAARLVEIIAKQVSKRKQETYGWTAEQLLERLESGQSALPLVTHLVNETKPQEIERLLSELLPKAYIDATEDTNSLFGLDAHLIQCFLARRSHRPIVHRPIHPPAFSTQAM